MLLKSFKQLFRKPKIKSSAWDASGSGRRLLHFQPESGSINNLLSQSLEHLRSRSRDMVRKNPYAANIVDAIVSNSVGTGIKPQSKAKDAEFRKKVQELWLKWTDEADSSGVSDFYGLQALVCRSMIEGGECFVRLRTRKRSEANIMGEGESNEQGVALSGLEPGTMQLLDPGEDIKFSQPSDVGGSYEAFMCKR